MCDIEIYKCLFTCKHTHSRTNTSTNAYLPPAGTLFATSHGDHAIRIYSVAAGKTIAVLEGHTRTPWTLCFHSQLPHLLVSGCLNGELRVWDVTTHTCLHHAGFFPTLSLFLPRSLSLPFCVCVRVCVCVCVPLSACLSLPRSHSLPVPPSIQKHICLQEAVLGPDRIMPVHPRTISACPCACIHP